ncbi:hypothetical protein HELRODRAFT_195040 [Helobdella robusta]|uniref:Uncharacterized protein n=1 Tax=Helobdella robusta TaxID=6412 RepID=T1FWP3_HELRO|nr:hypothetical protein HELRODRAFT_195040 [Helobdella robusta]ESO09711.1 hypothetical protein HELRODRAFT_195040 [Helobdella robusta]
MRFANVKSIIIFPVLLFAVTKFDWVISASSSTSTQNVPTVPTAEESTTTTTTQPPLDIPTTTANIFDIAAYYNLTKKTCCHIQTQCLNCTNFYNVNDVKQYFDHIAIKVGLCKNVGPPSGENCQSGLDPSLTASSIRYCCPKCAGYALVTDLICSCTPSGVFDPSIVQCKINKTHVVGNYIPWRPSYYRRKNYLCKIYGYENYSQFKSMGDMRMKMFNGKKFEHLLRRPDSKK